nr:site-specific integrase [Roseomonas acroporae]
MKLLKDIKQEQVDEAIEAICPGASPQRQVRAVITPLTAILNHAAYRDWCDPPRFKRPPGAAGEKRTRWLTPDEYRRLLTSASPHLQPMIVFMACTGARMGEVLTLQWRDVDLDHGRAVLRDVKAQHGVRRNRLCDLPPAAVEALRGIEGRQGEVFRTEDGKAYSGKGGLGSRAKSAWATACRRAGFEGEWVVTRWEDGTVRNRWWQVEDVTPHVLRHTWATWHYAVHRDLLKLKLDGDWSSVTLCERYAKLAPAAMAPAIMRCWGQEVAAQAVG